MAFETIFYHLMILNTTLAGFNYFESTPGYEFKHDRKVKKLES